MLSAGVTGYLDFSYCTNTHIFLPITCTGQTHLGHRRRNPTSQFSDITSWKSNRCSLLFLLNIPKSKSIYLTSGRYPSSP